MKFAFGAEINIVYIMLSVALFYSLNIPLIVTIKHWWVHLFLFDFWFAKISTTRMQTSFMLVKKLKEQQQQNDLLCDVSFFCSPLSHSRDNGLPLVLRYVYLLSLERENRVIFHPVWKMVVYTVNGMCVRTLSFRILLKYRELMCDYFLFSMLISSGTKIWRKKKTTEWWINLSIRIWLCCNRDSCNDFYELFQLDFGDCERHLLL